MLFSLNHSPGRRPRTRTVVILENGAVTLLGSDVPHFSATKWVKDAAPAPLAVRRCRVVDDLRGVERGAPRGAHRRSRSSWGRGWAGFGYMRSATRAGGGRRHARNYCTCTPSALSHAEIGQQTCSRNVGRKRRQTATNMRAFPGQHGTRGGGCRWPGGAVRDQVCVRRAGAKGR